jgi:hypothetical protein
MVPGAQVRSHQRGFWISIREISAIRGASKRFFHFFENFAPQFPEKYIRAGV